MVLSAATGDCSHHNVSDPFHAAMFGLMAVAAVVLTATQALLAWLIARHSLAPHTVFGHSVVIGLLLKFALRTVSGFLLGGQHPPAGVGLPVVGWQLGQADARPAHFMGVHAHQWIPMAGWLLQRYRVSNAGGMLAAFTISYGIVWTLLALWALP